MKLRKELLKVGNDGLCQIVVQCDVSRTNRPRIKSGIFIRPELWDSSTESIKKPKKGRGNLNTLEEAVTAEEKLNLFCAQLSQLVRVGATNVDVDKTWLTNCFALIASGDLTKIDSFADVQKAEKAKTQVSEVKSTIEAKSISHKSGASEFYDLVMLYCERHNLAESRVRVYKVLARMLIRFELYVQNKRTPRFHVNYETLTNDDIENFRVYMRNEYKYVEANPSLYKKIFKAAPQIDSKKFKNNKVEERSDNYIAGMLKKLSSVFHWLQDTGRTQNNPFKGVEFGRILYGRPIYINKEERDTIANFDLSSEDQVLQQQRDIFIFQCLVGCRVGDLLRFTKNNISGGFLEYVPSKTKGNEEQIKVRVPLNEMAKKLIEKYRNVDRKGRLFPFIEAHSYNVRIKQVFKKCGITRIVQVRNPKSGEYEARPINEIASSHMARRTFCGILYKKTKDPNVIGKMSGHVEGSKAFARYRDIDDDDLQNVINLM